MKMNNNLFIGIVYFVLGTLVANFLVSLIQKELNYTTSKKVFFILGIAYGMLYFVYGFNIYSILCCFLTSSFYYIGIYDYASKEVTNKSLFICAIITILIFLYNILIAKERYFDYLFSFIMSVLFFISMRFIGKILFKKEALGEGDIYIAGIFSIACKPFVMIVSIVIGSICGCVVELVKTKFDKDSMDVEIPFCPYLCFGFYTALLFSNPIMGLLG